MKVINYIYILLFALIALLPLEIKAQNKAEDIIFNALKDEMTRSLTDLKLDKYEAPFFIANYFSNCKAYVAKATLGALLLSKESTIRQSPFRMMVGDYAINDENFVGGSRSSSSGGANIALPIENDYFAIRRSIWSGFDRSYKSSIDIYTQKLTAISQQNKEESEKLDDYLRLQPVTYLMPLTHLKYDKSLWEKTIKEVSAVFNAYPTIQNSSVDLLFLHSNIYMINSEGTKVRIDAGVACCYINASTQAADGEILRDHVLYFAPVNNQLPNIDKIKNEVNQMADALQKRCSASVIEEAYQGPVIIEGDALAELFGYKMFGYSGLLSSREPIYAVGSSRGSSNKIENKIGKRLCMENISIKAEPKTRYFGTTPLIGSFEIDAEGVMPSADLMLVDKGILKTLLSDRVPTPKVKESNGHNRFSLLGGYQKSPGVINISYANGQIYSDLVTTVSKEAEKNGLDYFYVIRKFETPNYGNQDIRTGASGLTKPISIYKVNIKSGEEKLIRCANISEFPLLAFKYSLGGTSEQFVYNNLRGQFMPVSYILPKAMAFNDISIEKDNAPKAKLPIVENPLAVK